MKAKVVRQTQVKNSPSGETRYGYALSWGNGWRHTIAFWMQTFKPLVILLMFAAVCAIVFYLKSYNLYYYWYAPSGTPTVS
jgi:hypothetical protein